MSVVRVLLAVVVSAVVALPAAAAAEPWESRDHYIRVFYQDNPRDGLYEEWKRGRWSNEDYRNWYRTHHDDEARRGDLEAAALFGLATGSLTASARGEGASGETTGSLAVDAPPAGGFQAGTPGYNRYCAGKYRSFDPATGTYMSFSGERRHCR